MRAIERSEHERSWTAEMERFAHEQKHGHKRIYVSGALLPPTLYNPPLLRYKPDQPIGMTMMIRRRRMARVKRIARWNETQQAKHLGIADARAVKGAPDHVQAALDLPAEGELRTLPHIRLGLTARRVLCAARARDARPV